MSASASSVASSFRFHEQVESFGDFVRREWRAILFFGGGFTALLLAAVFLVDPSFFYPRLQTDSLYYYLKGKSLADTGTTAARLALNAPPFLYASMPGVLRAPLIAAFSDFDNQLRAIQVVNIAIIDTVALMSAYMLSWILPRNGHWIAIGFAFGFTLLSPWWMANVFLPMTDGPYAAFLLASVLIAVRVVASPRPLSVRKAEIFVFCAVFLVAFLLRYTEPVVLILVAILLSGRRASNPVSRRGLMLAAGLAVSLVLLLVVVNRDAIFGRYIAEPLRFLQKGDWHSILLNIFCLAIPDQIIPAFGLAFSHPPILDVYHAEFGTTTRDVAWSTVGAAISAVVLAGAWRLRRLILPEFLLFLGAFPVLAIMMPSTSRYFMTYQALFWMSFYEGGRALLGMIPQVPRRRLMTGAPLLAACALLFGLTLGIRSRLAAAGGTGGGGLGKLLNMQHYVHGVSDTYRPLRTFLERLPQDRAVLMSSPTLLGRWKAIANLDYYAADPGVMAVAASKQAYLVLECGSIDTCAHAAEEENRVKDALCRFGEFDYELVFAAKAAKSQARVFRVRPKV